MGKCGGRCQTFSPTRDLLIFSFFGIVPWICEAGVPSTPSNDRQSSVLAAGHVVAGETVLVTKGATATGRAVVAALVRMGATVSVARDENPRLIPRRLFISPSNACSNSIICIC